MIKNFILDDKKNSTIALVKHNCVFYLGLLDAVAIGLYFAVVRVPIKFNSLNTTDEYKNVRISKYSQSRMFQRE